MKKKKLINQLLSHFSLFLVASLVAAAPLFYHIITRYYAEDLIEVARMAHIHQSQLDIERDTVIGLAIQLLAIVGLFILSLLLMMRFIPMKLWRPFNDTLSKLRAFRVEDGKIPTFTETNIEEFAQLNHTLSHILTHSVKSYQVQKQFTENASHELQTPLAIVMGKLDLMLQTRDVTEEQAQLMQDIYHEVKRMSMLNRNLLLLARIENAQYQIVNHIVLAKKIERLMPSLELLTEGIHITTQINDRQAEVQCNEVLAECLINNLIVNAVRHNKPGGKILITVDRDQLSIANTAEGKPLDHEHLFERFYHSIDRQKGNGLGLAIAKSICDYHHWSIQYSFEDHLHVFRVCFSPVTPQPF